MENTIEEKWNILKKKYKLGDWLEGEVISHMQFGVFLDIGHLPVKGLIRIVNFLDEGIMSPSLYPKVGTKVRGVIVEFTDHNFQINLSLKKIDIQKYKNKGIPPQKPTY